MLCAILYHFWNLKNVKNPHEGVLLLVKLQAEAILGQKAKMWTSPLSTPQGMKFQASFFLLKIYWQYGIFKMVSLRIGGLSKLKLRAIFQCWAN